MQASAFIKDIAFLLRHRWLASKGRADEARRALMRLRSGEAAVDAELAKLAAGAADAPPARSLWRCLHAPEVQAELRLGAFLVLTENSPYKLGHRQGKSLYFSCLHTLHRSAAALNILSKAMQPGVARDKGYAVQGWACRCCSR